MKRNIIKGLIASFVLAFTFNSFMAEELLSKETSFELPQDYEGCSFTIATEHAGDFDVVLKSHNGQTSDYTAKIEDGNECTINVQDAREGKWTVKVTESITEEEKPSEQEISTESSEEATEDVVPERTVDEVIGKISISAKAIDKTAFAVGNVSVARDIVGLKYYFKDDSIVVEWTDLSCGNVNIAIIDSSTSQILDKQTIQDNYYEYEIPTLVKEIIIDVVPATSAGIVGANSQFTVPVINEPNADVIYDEKEYTNTDTIPVTVKLNDTYSLMFMSNGVETQNTGMLTKGEYTYEVPISEGSNTILTYVIDATGNMRSTAKNIIRDSIKPILTMPMEYDGVQTYSDIAYFDGTIKDYETFKINEVIPTVAGDGTFKAEYILNDGLNVVNFVATDIAGNETVYTAHITKLIEKPVDISFIIKIVVLIIIAVVVVITIIRKKKGNPEPPKKEKTEKKEKSSKEKTSKVNLSSMQKKMIEYGTIFVVSLLFFTFIIKNGSVPSDSMNPTLQVGDLVVANGLAYVAKEPQRGDIIIFKNAETNGETYIKRIIGLPGDDLMFVDGYLYLNGELVYEEYLPANIETNSEKDYVVPDGCYFVMGDNRENSNDSRFWNNPYLVKGDIKGKMITSIPTSRLINTLQNLF